MEDILMKIIGVCGFVGLVFAIISLNFWAIMECYGKILILCNIMKLLFCGSILIGSICMICLVMMLLCDED